jgi:hypothetical protein
MTRIKLWIGETWAEQDARNRASKTPRPESRPLNPNKHP